MGNPGEIEQAVSRTLRENLEKLQRTSDELSRAVNDLASACADAHPADALSPMLRAQTAAASLSASLEVLSRFVTAALQPELRSAAEQEAVTNARRVPDMRDAESAEGSQDLQPADGREAPAEMAPELAMETVTIEASDASDIAEVDASATVDEANSSDVPEELPPSTEPFDISALPAADQELHRRASRVAKVSMQDIRMLRPDDVRLGRENKNLCERLRDDIEKAHKEYDRRFHTISAHPVDYFYDWMVEILGDGNPETLGEYPYPSPVLRR
jgi:hypothetical protein